MSVKKPPRRVDVLDLIATFSRPVHLSELAARLGVVAGTEAALSRVIDDLVFDGTLTSVGGHRFRITKRERTPGRSDRSVEGFLTANARGFGFVAALGDADDVYIPQEAMGGALHGDKVKARIVRVGERGTEGAIVEIVERRSPRVSGTLRRRGKSAWLEPDDVRVRGPIVLHAVTEGEDGELAVAIIERFPETPDENPEGKIVEVLGPPGDPHVEARKILVLYDIVEAHGPQAEAEAEAFGPEVPPDALRGRVDLTHLPLPTIDPSDARDHDDALFAERIEGGGYRVWVAIADVSHYVRQGTELDREARSRGCSIYLPDRAIPMLPAALSSRLCSLLPGVVRLCLCVEATLDKHATVTEARVVEGYMRSQAKLTYEGVARALGLTSEGPRSEEADAMVKDLGVLHEIAGLLRARRMKRGALDLELPEARIIVDSATRLPISSVKRSRDPGVAKAYNLVEELMLLANETVADLLVKRGAPAIFRNHAAPDPAKMERFRALCERLGVTFDAEQAESPKALAAFMREIKAHAQRSILDMLLVRSLKQAYYDVANVGHFGLASDAYLHFTSPIRRYPDLAVHRVVRALSRGDRVDLSDEALGAMRDAAKLASERERTAMKVERDIGDLYRAVLMKDSLGQTFAGTVSSVISAGVFVTLEEPFVDVLVRSEGLGRDSYQPDEDALAMIGVRSGDRIQVGDGMMVIIEDISIVRRTIYGRRVSVGASEDLPEGSARPPTRASKRRESTQPSAEAPARARGPMRGRSKSASSTAKAMRKAKKSTKSASKSASKTSAKPSRAQRKKSR